ncbi:hypothetical protein ISN45_Aa08g005230 [Arabidopsis thaliana x Arabidopsis arenosa]|uniref:Uncharacterized protein n=1 Tax=Arabidopsis thaliana x Arabidopsis arenosa TaxID=1240361 RepID=A0A8T1XJV9_9BRAS|nr:hypothetical protein ISN45_Aa08g005230 [Arabidopsis thaliana x Arabidopsis arenosa]
MDLGFSGGDHGTEYLVRPVGRAEDEEDASDFEPKENGVGEDIDEGDDDENDNSGGAGESEAPQKKRALEEDKEDSGDEDDDRPPKRSIVDDEIETKLSYRSDWDAFYRYVKDYVEAKFSKKQLINNVKSLKMIIWAKNETEYVSNEKMDQAKICVTEPSTLPFEPLSKTV